MTKAFVGLCTLVGYQTQKTLQVGRARQIWYADE